MKTAEDRRAGRASRSPELLDWLAVEFRDSGWNLKHLLRLIVTSHALDRRACPPRWSNAILQPLPWRPAPSGCPPGYSAIKALAISGLLVDDLGGGSRQTLQPAGIWEEFSFGQIRYQQDRLQPLSSQPLHLLAPNRGTRSLFDLG
ncbi:MAG: DUF1553 domain-containing protein [Gemmataceae bacterium]